MRFKDEPPSCHVAPMLHVTDRHFRTFMRNFTRHAPLWTEMLIDQSILHNQDNLEPFLGFSECEHPVICQFGGSDPTTLAKASVIAASYGYDEINLNVGCPSNKVARLGHFGVTLMKDGERVRDICHAIGRQVQIPVSVKTRIAVDEFDDYDFLKLFIATVSSGGCHKFSIHARKAWSKGLNPKQNRTIPKLDYDRVFRLAKDFPDSNFILNGGVETLEQGLELCRVNDAENHDGNYFLDGVMIGRAVYKNPVMLRNVDTLYYGAKQDPPTARTRRTALEAYIKYLESIEESQTPLKSRFDMMKPILGILYDQPGNRMFRNILDCNIREISSEDSVSSILWMSMEAVEKQIPMAFDTPF